MAEIEYEYHNISKVTYLLLQDEIRRLVALGWELQWQTTYDTCSVAIMRKEKKD